MVIHPAPSGGRAHPLDNRHTESPCRGCGHHGQIDWCRANCEHGAVFYKLDEKGNSKISRGAISAQVPREYHEMPINEAIRLYSERHPCETMNNMARLFGVSANKVSAHVSKEYVPLRWGQKRR